MSWLCSSVAAALARSLAGAWNALRCNALQQRPPAPGIVRSTRYLPWTRPALDSPSRIGEIALVAMPRPPSPAPTAREACSHAAHARWPNTRSTLARSLACLLACLSASCCCCVLVPLLCPYPPLPFPALRSECHPSLHSLRDSQSFQHRTLEYPCAHPASIPGPSRAMTV